MRYAPNNLLHGTGLSVASAASRNNAADAISPRVLDVIKGASGKMDDMKNNLRHYMIAAGLMEDGERAENISNAETENNAKNEEANTMAKYEFTENTVTIDGTAYPAGYSVTPERTVFAFVGIAANADGSISHKYRLRFAPDCEGYAAALAAALASGCRRPERSGSIPGPAATAKAGGRQETPKPEFAYADENGAARDPKTARGPVPEKTFIGSAIQGRGWKILFDGSTSRTRVIFEGRPTDAALAAIEGAGFYYSPNMGSWNKKLTFRAYRAAQALSCALNELYAA